MNLLIDRYLNSPVLSEKERLYLLGELSGQQFDSYGYPVGWKIYLGDGWRPTMEHPRIINTTLSGVWENLEFPSIPKNVQRDIIFWCLDEDERYQQNFKIWAGRDYWVDVQCIVFHKLDPLTKHYIKEEKSDKFQRVG